MPRVKVNSEVHAKLKLLQEKLPLSFNDLINIGLTIMVDQAKGNIFVENEIEKITVNLKRMKIPMDTIASLKERGVDIFLPSITRRKANYLKSRIEKELGCKLLVLDSTFGSETGFLFFFVEDFAKKQAET